MPFLANSDVVIARCRPAQPQAELYRNALADEIIFVHRGRGMLQTMFGLLAVKPFDYVVIPRCTTYRLDFDAGASPDLLVIEASGNVGIPKRYVNPDGQIKMGAPILRAGRLPRPPRTGRPRERKRIRPSSSRMARG